MLRNWWTFHALPSKPNIRSNENLLMLVYVGGNPIHKWSSLTDGRSPFPFSLMGCIRAEAAIKHFLWNFHLKKTYLTNLKPAHFDIKNSALLLLFLLFQLVLFYWGNYPKNLAQACSFSHNCRLASLMLSILTDDSTKNQLHQK